MQRGMQRDNMAAGGMAGQMGNGMMMERSSTRAGNGGWNNIHMHARRQWCLEQCLESHARPHTLDVFIVVGTYLDGSDCSGGLPLLTSG